jgi:hypothetical protein
MVRVMQLVLLLITGIHCAVVSEPGGNNPIQSVETVKKQKLSQLETLILVWIVRIWPTCMRRDSNK